MPSNDPDRPTTVHPFTVDEAPDDDLLMVSTSSLGGDVVQVQAWGEIDMISADFFRQALSTAARSVQDPGVPMGRAGSEVVCDLSGVRFFGAAGLRALLDVASSARQDGVTVTVVPSRCVRRVMTVTGTAGEVPVGGAPEQTGRPPGGDRP